MVNEEEFSFLTGINLDNQQYLRLKNCLSGLMKKYFTAGKEPVMLGEFFGGIKKGSKQFRIILSYHKRKKGYFLTLPQVKTYQKVTEIAE